MNLKRTLTGTLAIATLLLGACGDDEKASPKEEFTFGGETISLKDGLLYLDYNGTYNGTHIYRDYLITNADETYYILFELAVPNGEEIGSGEYPAFSDWDEPSETSNIAYIEAEGGEDEEYVELYTPGDADGSDEIVVSGGVDDGDTMTVKFKGTLTFYHFDEEEQDWIEENVSGKFYIKAKVEDISSSPAKMKHFERGEKRSH